MEITSEVRNIIIDYEVIVKFKPMIFNPISYRDFLTMEGISIDKASNIVIKIAKKQGFDRKSLERLKQQLSEIIMKCPYCDKPCGTEWCPWRKK